jgi:hypothetical protein
MRRRDRVSTAKLYPVLLFTLNIIILILVIGTYNLTSITHYVRYINTIKLIYGTVNRVRIIELYLYIEFILITKYYPV